MYLFGYATALVAITSNETLSVLYSICYRVVPWNRGRFRELSPLVD